MCFGHPMFVIRIAKLKQEGRYRFSKYGFIRNFLTHQLKASAVFLYCVIACIDFLQPAVWFCQTIKVLRHLHAKKILVCNLGGLYT